MLYPLSYRGPVLLTFILQGVMITRSQLGTKSGIKHGLTRLLPYAVKNLQRIISSFFGDTSNYTEEQGEPECRENPRRLLGGVKARHYGQADNLFQGLG